MTDPAVATHGSVVALPDGMTADPNSWCTANSFKAYSYGASWAASFRDLGAGCLGLTATADIYRIHHTAAMRDAGQSCAHRCATEMMCVGYDERDYGSQSKVIEPPPSTSTRA